MFPFGLAIGFIAGAATVVVIAPQIAHRARPLAKAALKAAMAAMHEAQVRGAEVAEAAEDLYAEVKDEVREEVVTAATAESGATAKATRGESPSEAA